MGTYIFNNMEVELDDETVPEGMGIVSGNIVVDWSTGTIVSVNPGE